MNKMILNDYLYLLKDYFTSVKVFFKEKYEYLTKGYSDVDTWSLDYKIAKYVLPRLKRFKEITHTHPLELTSEEWDVILDKMIFSFERLSDENWLWGETKNKDIEKVKEGLELFSEYYLDLWW